MPEERILKQIVDWFFDGVRLPSQNCGLGPIVISSGDSDVDLGR
jgi:hypothetical protein